MEYRWAYGETPLTQDAMAVRIQVFVREQGFAEKDQLDGLNANAWHLVGYTENEPVCTARLVPEDGTVWHLGRVAVLARMRGQGKGRLLLEQAFAKARQLGITHLTLTAQADKVGFYKAMGFVPHGETYIHENYPHIDMTRTL